MSFFGVEDQAETIEQLSAAPDVEAVGTRSELLAATAKSWCAATTVGSWPSRWPTSGSRARVAAVVSAGRPPGAGETAIGTGAGPPPGGVHRRHDRRRGVRR